MHEHPDIVCNFASCVDHLKIRPTGWFGKAHKKIKTRVGNYLSNILRIS